MMATVTKTIGTASRDYSTITLWEADLDNVGVYSSGDDAVGEMYNDSAFDETVVIDSGTTSAIATRTLRPATGEGHDGTAGSGVRIVLTADAASRVIDLHENKPNRLDQIEIDGNGNWWSSAVGVDTDLSQVITRMLVHGASGSTNNVTGLSAGGCIYANCIVYDLEQTAGNAKGATGISQAGNTAATCRVRNCTVWNIQNNNGTGTAIGFHMPAASTKSCINCVGGGSTGTTSGTIRDWNNTNYTVATSENNASSDSSANGTGAVTNVVGADAFVSVTGGSEDFHLKSGSVLIDAGQDLGTSEVYAVDIDGRNRDTEGDTWDVGADEFVGGGDENSRYYFQQIAAAVAG